MFVKILQGHPLNRKFFLTFFLCIQACLLSAKARGLGAEPSVKNAGLFTLFKELFAGIWCACAGFSWQDLCREFIFGTLEPSKRGCHTSYQSLTKDMWGKFQLKVKLPLDVCIMLWNTIQIFSPGSGLVSFRVIFFFDMLKIWGLSGRGGGYWGSDGSPLGVIWGVYSIYIL